MRVVVAVGIAAALVAGVVVAERLTGREVEVAAPEALVVRAERLPDGTPVFVTKTAGDVAVVDARSPHWLEDGLEVYLAVCANTLVAWEPWYASMFDHTGRWLGGPAPAGLVSYEAELDGAVVRVGERRTALPRDGDTADHVPPGACAWRWSHPQIVHHHLDASADALSPEELAAASQRQPTLVLAAVERVGADTRRACSWQRTETVQGPLCDDDAPVVEPSPFGFLSKDLDDEGEHVVGSYGLYLMTSADGRLQVHGAIPQQIEYWGSFERVSGVSSQD